MVVIVAMLLFSHDHMVAMFVLVAAVIIIAIVVMGGKAILRAASVSSLDQPVVPRRSNIDIFIYETAVLMHARNGAVYHDNLVFGGSCLVCRASCVAFARGSRSSPRVLPPISLGHRVGWCFMPCCLSFLTISADTESCVFLRGVSA